MMHLDTSVENWPVEERLEWASQHDRSSEGKLTHLLRPPCIHAGGLLWTAALPADLACAGDCPASPKQSRLILLEDGRPLGPAHTVHATIQQNGGGAYSHWNDNLLFSTTDGTDPNTNGRQYAVVVGPAKLSLLGFGSCHVHDAIRSLDRADAALMSWADPALSNSASETMQMIRWLRGDLRIAAPLLRLTALENLPPGSHRNLAAPDVVFFEVCTNIEIEYESVFLSRASLIARIFAPAIALGREEGRIAKKWYHEGLQRQNEPLRVELARKLAVVMRRAEGAWPADAEIVLGTRARKQRACDILQAIHDARDLFGCPICVLSAPAVYTPDGRPVSWPANFPKELGELCRKAGLPVLNWHDQVARYGMAFSVQKDLHHYTPEFIERFGTLMLATAQGLLKDKDESPRPGGMRREASYPLGRVLAPMRTEAVQNAPSR